MRGPGKSLKQISWKVKKEKAFLEKEDQILSLITIREKEAVSFCDLFVVLVNYLGMDI